MDNFKTKLDNYFHITERGSTIKTEIVAGLTTFFAMCYILLVNPDQMTGFQASKGGEFLEVYSAVFIATAIGAFVGTILMALYAKMPYAQAPGMGLNSFFASVFVFGVMGAGLTIGQQYQKGLAVILLSGLLFVILSITGARKAIANALPNCLKKSIPAGIGLFIAFIGLKNATVIQDNPYTFVQLANLAVFDPSQTITWYNMYDPLTGNLIGGIAPVLTAFIGLIIIAVLNKFKVKGAVIIGILSSTALFYLFNIGAPLTDITYGAPVVIDQVNAFSVFHKPIIGVGEAFKNFGKWGIGGAFKGFGNLFTASGDLGAGATFLSVIMLVITFCLVDMFDTLGTLQGTATEAGMLTEDNLPMRLDECMISDSVATVVGAIAGTSTVTTYVESAAGVSAGGRTGLTALVVAILFLISMFLSPIAVYIPTAATAPALIWVGVLMLKNFKDVDMDDVTNAVPAFLTLIMMPLTYSISNGIAIGMISYTVMRLFTGKFQKKDILVAILGLLFTLRFFSFYM